MGKFFNRGTPLNESAGEYQVSTPPPNSSVPVLPCPFTFTFPLLGDAGRGRILNCFSGALTPVIEAAFSVSRLVFSCILVRTSASNPGDYRASSDRLAANRDD